MTFCIVLNYYWLLVLFKAVVRHLSEVLKFLLTTKSSLPKETRENVPNLKQFYV